MKILRVGPVGEERPAVMDAGGKLYDISHVVPDISPQTLAAGCLERIAGLNFADLPPVVGTPRIGPPVNAPQKFLAIGKNYAAHAAEMGGEAPEHPIVFSKQPSCICGPNDDILLPPDAEKADHEVELGVVMGRAARRVKESKALDFVAGYLLVNDVSERAWQLEHGGQWTKGKSSDTFGPIGPWLLTADELPNPQAVDLQLKLNGEVMQRGNTKDMIFSVAELIAHISRYMTLLPGDIITTGTPPGVGMGRTPPRYLRDGDVLELSATGLGTQRQHVRRLTE